jgi:hypothetical protein
MPLPSRDELRRLLDWEPDLGVLSVCLHVDHADRGGGWRIALTDALREALAGQEEWEHDLKVAARATADRLLARYGKDERPPDGCGQLGLIEIGREPGREHWWFSEARPREEASVAVAPRPSLGPLVEMLDDHRRRGVVAVTGERARLLEWEEETLSEIADEEILTTGDWRERKAWRPSDPARGQGISSSGRDQHEQRLDHARSRFVGAVADEVDRLADDRGWTEILGFGDGKYLSELEQRLGAGRLVHSENKNLIPAAEADIAARVRELSKGLNRRRELELIERAEQRAMEGGRGALGLQETAQALAQGRVDHLLIDAARLAGEPDESLAGALAIEGSSATGSRTAEVLIQRALATGAGITPVEGEAADRLGAHEGAAALLRY